MKPLSKIHVCSAPSLIALAAPVLLLALAACSSDDVVTGEPTDPSGAAPIVIGSQGIDALPAAISRADVPLEAYDTHFGVYGYKFFTASTSMQTVFPGYAVEWTNNSAGATTTNSSGWEYDALTALDGSTQQSIKYWDYAAVDYAFYAYSYNPDIAGESAGTFTLRTGLDDGAVYTTVADDGQTTVDHTNAEADYASSDALSAAQAVFPADYGQVVNLLFRHVMAQVRIAFVAEAAPATASPITDIRFAPDDGSLIAQTATASFKAQPTFSYTNGVLDPQLRDWFTLTTTAETDTLRFNTVTLPAGEVQTVSSETFYRVIPRWFDSSTKISDSVSDAAWLLRIKLWGEEKTAIVPATYFRWLPGYSYTYIFKLDTELHSLIFVDATVNPWTYGGGVDAPQHNW